MGHKTLQCASRGRDQVIQIIFGSLFADRSPSSDEIHEPVTSHLTSSDSSYMLEAVTGNETDATKRVVNHVNLKKEGTAHFRPTFPIIGAQSEGPSSIMTHLNNRSEFSRLLSFLQLHRAQSELLDEKH